MEGNLVIVPIIKSSFNNFHKLHYVVGMCLEPVSQSKIKILVNGEQAVYPIQLVQPCDEQTQIRHGYIKKSLKPNVI